MSFGVRDGVHTFEHRKQTDERWHVPRKQDVRRLVRSLPEPLTERIDEEVETVLDRPRVPERDCASEGLTDEDEPLAPHAWEDRGEIEQVVREVVVAATPDPLRASESA